MKLKPGKIPESILQKTVIGQIENHRPEVLLGPGIGEDCAALALPEGEVLVLSTDPITGTATDIGKLGILVTLNDLASAGAEPVGVLLTVLLPVDTEEAVLAEIMQQVNAACMKENIAVIGGHTEVTAVVNQPVVTVTGMGKVKKGCVITTGGAKPGMDLVMTKSIGLEGASILAKEKHDLLTERITGTDRPADAETILSTATAFDQQLSVLPESRIAVACDVAAMHDVTEGGIRGAVWEMTEASGVGARVYQEQVTMWPEVKSICDALKLDPYGLISSGCMLMASADGETLVDALRAAGIPAAVIGQTTADPERVWVSPEGETAIGPPAADELYKA